MLNLRKNDLLKYLDWFSAVVVTNALVFTLLFQFTQIESNLQIALWSYIIGFVSFMVLSIMRIICSKKVKYNESESELVLSRKQVVFITIKCVLSLLVVIFAVMILFLW